MRNPDRVAKPFDWFLLVLVIFVLAVLISAGWLELMHKIEAVFK